MHTIDKVHTRPGYTEKIIQFGEGGFLRGFVDWIVQLVNESSDFNAGVTVVQPIAHGMCDKLEAQNCLYTHIARGMEGDRLVTDTKIIDVITRTVKPYEDFAAYLALAENPDYRFVVSNTTESGIAYCSDDTPDKAPHITFPAKVTLLLYKRFSLGLPGFVFLPCELIDKNGATLKKYILDYAALWGYGGDFAAWVEQENIFCNTLVDRIVTGYPGNEDMGLPYIDHMCNTSELFHLWVIEGPAAIGEEFPFAKAGLNVILTDNLEKYRTRKVRILNGAHTSMIPYAMLTGIETVRDCMNHPAMSTFVKACVYEEIMPTLDLPAEELKSYADDVFRRFENPYIHHLCASISLNSVSKFKVRVLPSILEYIRRFDKMPGNLLLSFAKLIDFYRQGTPTDDPAVIEKLKNPDLSAILADASLWGEDVSFLSREIAGRMQQ